MTVGTEVKLAMNRPGFEDVQAELADIPGEEGIRRRREAYRPYFLRFGKDVRIGEGCRFYHPQRISLDDDVRINVNALVYGSGGVHIGRHARIGPRCLMHSANHDVSVGPLAFFERGYSYESVWIGDNCLISANVSLLAGTRLAAGNFVACGAVVTQGSYDADTRLAGIPARQMTVQTPGMECEAAPSVAVVTPAKSWCAEAAKLLVGALGLPQVAVLGEKESLPDSVHTVIVLGDPPRSGGPRGTEGRTVWTVRDGDRRLGGRISVRIGAGGESPGELVELPAGLEHVGVPTADPSLPPLDNACALTNYYVHKRLRKRVPTPAEWGEHALAAVLLTRFAPAGLRGPEQGLLEALKGLALPDDAQRQSDLNALRGALLADAGSQDAAMTCREYLLKAMRAGEEIRERALHEPNRGFRPETMSVCPEIASALALQTDPEDRNWISLHLDEWIDEATTAIQLTHFAAAAILLDNNAGCARAIDRMLAAPLYDPAMGCVKSTPDSTGACYSSLLAAVLMIAAHSRDPKMRLRTTEHRLEPLEWTVFTEESAACWEVQSADGRGALIAPSRRVISSSLLNSWLACHRPPALDGLQLELLDHCYLPVANRIEQIWLSLFRHIQHEAGEPLLRVHPWPSGYRLALSLRYDIDRETSAEECRRIFAIQREQLGAACGSWFAIPETSHGERLQGLLRMHLQEVGVHGLGAGDAASGLGATMHSASNSQYWRGRDTVLELEQRGAAYGEMLSSQSSVPRRAWIEQGRRPRRGDVWLAPIHFPLEGSTNDKDLSYFDRLLERFRDLVEQAGHVIIGTHPDLDQELLVQLLRREQLSDVWAAPIATVVDRCRQLLDYGAVRCCHVPHGEGVHVVCSHTVADVALELDRPDAATETLCVQFNAGIPRPLQGV